jgi:hypothetical protein
MRGPSVGALCVVVSSPEIADEVRSQLSVRTRSEISNSPAYGARLVAQILNDPELFEEWKRDIKTMAGCIIKMRDELYGLLTEEFKIPGTSSPLTSCLVPILFVGEEYAPNRMDPPPPSYETLPNAEDERCYRILLRHEFHPSRTFLLTPV